MPLNMEIHKANSSLTAKPRVKHPGSPIQQHFLQITILTQSTIKLQITNTRTTMEV